MSLVSAIYLFIIRYTVFPDGGWSALRKCQIAFSVVGFVLLLISGISWHPIVSGGVATDKAQPSVWRIATPFLVATVGYHFIELIAEFYHKLMFRLWELEDPISAAWFGMAHFQVGAVVGAAVSAVPIFRGRFGWAATQLLGAIPAAGIGLCTDRRGLVVAWCIAGLGFGAMRAASFTLLGEAVDGNEVPLNVGVLVSLGVIGQQFGAALFLIVSVAVAPAYFSAIIILAAVLILKKSAGRSE
jgi:hypothetical protein